MPQQTPHLTLVFMEHEPAWGHTGATLRTTKKYRVLKVANTTDIIPGDTVFSTYLNNYRNTLKYTIVPKPRDLPADTRREHR